MMNTPIYDFLREYSGSAVRAHMPGHHGRIPFGELEKFSDMYKYDVTEIHGADSLFEADGIIRESEKNTAELYGCGDTIFSAGGSTNCIQAMLYAMKLENRRVFAVRNVHRAFLNACALLDIDVTWIMPDYTNGILSGIIRPDDIEAFLSETENACLYVTSPDYTGRLADIPTLAEICHRHGAILIVDNAHGAHLHFFRKSLHPMANGADMCCDSAHKMLPALTGAAMLHMADGKYRDTLKQAMSMFASTSPSYLIMMSLDLCNKYIAEKIRRDIDVGIYHIHKLRKRLSHRVIFAESEPFHITINAAKSGYNGNELAQLLREYGVECEYADNDTVILLMSPLCSENDYSQLSDALSAVIERAERMTCTHGNAPIFMLPEKKMTIREAVFSPCEEIPVDKAEGRICASVKVPCPPAIPIAASGEIINKNCIEIFKNYSISKIIVVK